jgi:tetratricopeptide (TPR) repeat protein
MARAILRAQAKESIRRCVIEEPDCHDELVDAAYAMFPNDTTIKKIMFMKTIKMGIANERLERFHEALKDYDKCLRIYPAHHIVVCEIGIVKLKLGMLEEALEKFEESLRNCPSGKDQAIILGYRGIVEMKIGMLKEALDDFEASIQIYPENPMIIEYQNRAMKIMRTCEDYGEETMA